MHHAPRAMHPAPCTVHSAHARRHLLRLLLAALLHVLRRQAGCLAVEIPTVVVVVVVDDARRYERQRAA